MDAFCRVACIWKSAANRRSLLVSPSVQPGTKFSPVSFLPPPLEASDEAQQGRTNSMKTAHSSADCSMVLDIHDDVPDIVEEDVSAPPSNVVPGRPSKKQTSDVATEPPSDVASRRSVNKRQSADRKEPLRKKQKNASDSERRNPVIVYGIHMLKYNNSNPRLEVHAPMNIEKLSFDAKCRWLDVPELADMWFASMNLAGEALRHVNAKLPIRPRVLTCDVFNSLSIDPASNVRLHDLRKQSKMDSVFS